MSEYRHIANLQGPQGTPATEILGATNASSWPLSLSADIDSLEPGVYHSNFASTSEEIGLPGGGRTGSLEVLYGTDDRLVQRFSTTASPNFPFVQWHRSQGTDGSWSEWDQTHPSGIQGEGVQWIIASKDAEHPLEDGDLLVLLDTPSYFTDFRFDSVGQTPEGWTTRWASEAGDWYVDSEPSVPGGRVLRVQNGDLLRKALSWDIIPDSDVVEVLVKMRSANVSHLARATVGASGDTGSETGGFGYLLNQNPPVISGAVIRDGSTATSTTRPAISPYSAGGWIFSRVRLQGSYVSVKYWAEGAVEPNGWSSEVLLGTPLPNDWNGIHVTGEDVQIAFVSAAIDGGRAPKGAW